MNRYLDSSISTVRGSLRWRAGLAAVVAGSVAAVGIATGSASAGPPAGSASVGPSVGPASAGPSAGPASVGSASAHLPVDSAGPSIVAGHQRDLIALHELRQRQDQAWERGDARAYAAVYTPDADLVTFNGDHLSTRAGIEEGMAYYFTTYLKGTRLLQRDERIRFPEPDMAVIVRTGCVLWQGETACTDEALSVNTNVAVKKHGRWLYTSFQNTRIRPLRPATAPTVR